MQHLKEGAKMASPRNIVPLITPSQVAEFEATTPVAHLTDHGGPLLSAVEVQAIFWGEAWQQPAQSALIPRVGDFFTFILQSSLMDLMAEFGRPETPIGHGQFVGSVTTTTPELGSTVSDAQIKQALQGWI